MQGLGWLGKLLLITGSLLVFLGLFLIILQKMPFPGRLPGDILVSKKNFTIYFPITTCVIISLAVSFILWFFSRK